MGADRSDEFGELEEFLDDSITLPLPGRNGKTKVYVIAAVDGETGLWAERLFAEIMKAQEGGDPDAGKLDDGNEQLFYERMLGDTLGEMVADGVKWPRISHAAMTVYTWTTTNRETAIKYWKAGGNPERARPAGNRASRRASAAAARSTKKQGSGSGTKARKTSGRKKGSAGKKS